MKNRIAAACGIGVLLVGATACGGKDDDTGTPRGNATSGPQTTQEGSGQFPGANGKVAAVDGSTAQVQSPQNGQVAVTWNDSTTFTREVSGKLSDVEVGDCVAAMPDLDSASSTDSSDSSDDTEVTAATVRITSTSGDCTSGFGPGGGQRPQFNGSPPSGAPSGFPTDGPGAGRMRGSFGAIGTVTAVSSTGFTVEAVRPDTTTSVAVTVTSSTTYTKNAAASAADVKVGSCLVAQGTTDDTGAVTAKTVALSAAVDGECGGGFLRTRIGQDS